MQLSGVFLQLGEERLPQLLRGISIGKLKTYQLYERFKIAHPSGESQYRESAQSRAALLAAAERRMTKSSRPISRRRFSFPIWT